MTALIFKNRSDEYKEVSTDEGTDAIARSPNYTDHEEGVGLLSTERSGAWPKRKRSDCCVCCGINCGLFWKAFGIVVAAVTLWCAFKLIQWAIAPDSTGLEVMPVYSTSLGCNAAPYIYNSSKTVFRVPMGTLHSDHAVEIYGSAVGTFTIAQGSSNSTEVEYETTLRADDQSLLQEIFLEYSTVDPEDGHVTNSRLLISTPHIEPRSLSCMRYDITMYVPPTLKRLRVAAHTTTHIQFDPDSNINLDGLLVNLYSMNAKNMILPHEGLLANHMTLELYRGWIVGDVSIVNSTIITTQRGDGISNIRVHPTAPVDPALPDPAYLRTTTGAGRTDIFYVNHKEYPHRPIRSVHMSSRNADVYLTYRDAEYNGFIILNSHTYTSSGIKTIATDQPETNDEADGNGGKMKWTHWVGNKDGGDKLFVRSRGWTGLYF